MNRPYRREVLALRMIGKKEGMFDKKFREFYELFLRGNIRIVVTGILGYFVILRYIVGTSFDFSTTKLYIL